MGYAQAIEKAWKDVSDKTEQRRFSIELLSDRYDIDLDSRSIMSSSCNIPAKDHVSIILLHYLAKRLSLGALPKQSGEWIDFRQLDGGEGYYPAFKKRTIDHIITKYGSNPDAFLKAAERMGAKSAELGDVSAVIYPFKDVGILVKISRPDEEFGPDANILFDRSISGIFCTEDMVVLTEIMIHQL